MKNWDDITKKQCVKLMAGWFLLAAFAKEFMMESGWGIIRVLGWILWILELSNLIWGIGHLLKTKR